MVAIYLHNTPSTDGQSSWPQAPDGGNKLLWPKRFRNTVPQVLGFSIGQTAAC